MVSPQVVTGVKLIANAQSLFAGCANRNFEIKMKINSSVPVRAVVVLGDMVFQGF